MDLSPRHELDDVDGVRRSLLRSRRTKVVLASVVLVVIAGFVLIQGLRNATFFDSLGAAHTATLFFRNVDEAVAERDELGDRRFRLQGRVVPASVTSEGGVTTFDVVFNCRVAAVRHLTDPPDLFESPWIPVVLEGRWTPGEVTTVGGTDSHYFLSDRMLVKHTNEYGAENEERVALDPPEGFLDSCPDVATAAASESASS